jgi:hypothetical protein
LPGGLPRSFAVILTVTVSAWLVVCMVLLFLGTVIGSFVRSQEPSRVPAGQKRRARGARGHWRPHPACPGSLARRPGGLLGAAGGPKTGASRRGPNDHLTGDTHVSRRRERTTTTPAKPGNRTAFDSTEAGESVAGLRTRRSIDAPGSKSGLNRERFRPGVPE